MNQPKQDTPPPPVGRPAGALSRWAWGAVLVALVAVTYWPTLDNAFVSDDSWFVADTAKLSSLSGLGDIWFKVGVVPQYYPVTYTVQWIEYQFWELHPRGFHAVNMVLHAAVVLLLWWLLARLNVPGAWLAAAIFAVHPVQVETVAWASEIKNVLSGALAIGSLLAYLRFSPPEPAAPEEPDAVPRSEPWGYYALALALFLGAVLSKTSTISIPAVLLVIYWWKRGRVEGREAVRLLPFFAIGIGLVFLTVWMEGKFIGAVGPEWNLSWLERVLIAGRAVWFYAWELVWPYPLAFNYPRWQIDVYAGWQYLFPAAALGLLTVLWLLQKQIGRGPLAAALIFGGVLLPALGFFNVYWFLSSFVADHFQYHASMALIALAAAAAARLAAACPPGGYRVGVATAACVLGVLAFMAHEKTYAYQNDETLIRDNVALTPTSWAAHKNLGNWLTDHGEPEEAIAEYRQALELFPKRAQLHNSIGLTLEKLGRQDEAADEFEDALRGTLDDEQQYVSHFHLTQIRKAQTRYDEARSHGAAAMEAAVRVAPNDAQVRLDAGALLLALGNLPRAEEHLRRAIQLNPRNADAHNFLGELLVRRGDRLAAMSAFQTALTLDPNHAAAARNQQENLQRYRPLDQPAPGP